MLAPPTHTHTHTHTRMRIIFRSPFTTLCSSMDNLLLTANYARMRIIFHSPFATLLSWTIYSLLPINNVIVSLNRQHIDSTLNSIQINRIIMYIGIKINTQEWNIA